jgi:1-acyl-sn-glycerol-3-phosphate acyltransferase
VPELTHAEAHRIARERGISPWLYRLFKLIFVPLLRIAFGLRVTGVEHVPATGPAVIVPNHKSFWDAFFVAVPISRRVHFMGKAELFHGWRGRLFLALGGFPVKRGESDAEAIETARAILARGDVLALFPEGTRVPDPDALGTPKRGAARLAIEAGAPLVPAAITGTERRRFHLPRQVQIAFGEPVAVTGLSPTPEAAGELIDEAVWPEITEAYRGLRSRPGLIAAGVAAVGLGIAIQRTRSKR